MSEVYNIVRAVMLFLFGIVLITYHKDIAQVIIDSQHKDSFMFQKRGYSEKIRKSYADKLCFGVGIAFLIAGVVQMFR